MLTRRNLLNYSALAGGSVFFSKLPLWAQANTLDVTTFKTTQLEISQGSKIIAKKASSPILINNSFPGPLLRWREGDQVNINVRNELAESTSIHWHGILLPYQMDGVPGLSFNGIPPNTNFNYQFNIKQSGTYWYHSHSGMQEQLGHYGPIIIDPNEPEPFSYDNEFIILLSDWTFEDPNRIFNKLKANSGSFNFQKKTLTDLFSEIKNEGISSALANRMMWGQMRMDQTDISDVTGSTYQYLLNGLSPAENWTGIYSPGQRIRLRIINASAMSIFNVRIPDLSMQVIQADGINIKPVITDELQVGTGETFDCIIDPSREAYTLMCESNDRSGFAMGTIGTSQGITAEIPPLRKRPTLSMKDMGMNHSAPEPMVMDHSTMGHSAPEPMVMDHSTMDELRHAHLTNHGVVHLTASPTSRLNERPLGLEDETHRVLTYAELQCLDDDIGQAYTRTLELHLTSNMERYMWSFDGVKFSEVTEPIYLKLNEVVRLNLVNDTMMPHPIHLHGSFFRLISNSNNAPKKHTVVIKPGELLTIDIQATEPGYWAFHCHFLYHMMAGMMRVFKVDNA